MITNRYGISRPPDDSEGHILVLTLEFVKVLYSATPEISSKIFYLINLTLPLSRRRQPFITSCLHQSL